MDDHTNGQTTQQKNWFPADPGQQNSWKPTGWGSIFSLDLESDHYEPPASSGKK